MKQRFTRHGIRALPLLLVLVVLLVCVGALLPMRGAMAQDPVEDFSLVSWTAGQAANVDGQPVTVRRQQEKADASRECGNDRSCYRRRAVGR